MQLIDQERAALVEELNSRARTMFDTATGDLLDSAEWTKSDRYDFYTMLADQLTEEAVEMFEKHLADRAATVAKPDAETVERVAKAIHRRGPASGQDFRYRPETEQEMYRDMARAALAAAGPDPEEFHLERAADAIHEVDREMFPYAVRHIPSRTVYLERARAALSASRMSIADRGMPSISDKEKE